MDKKKRRFKDSHGHIVMPLEISGDCVVFMREGYPHPCQQPLERFKADYVEVKDDCRPE